MSMESPDYVARLVESQLKDITDPVLVARIRELLVVPYAVDRAWDYGLPGQHYKCWTVLEHPQSNMGIAFCSEGFGPTYPWGLVFLAGEFTGIGIDSLWYLSLEDAMRNSTAWNGPNPPGYEAQ